jgi:hypothetical protein
MAASGMRLLRRALLVWFALLVAAFVNGGLREIVLVPLLGRAAEMVSVAILVAVLVLGAWWMVRRTRPRRRLRVWLLIGVLWAGLTLAFELLFFRYVAGVPWETLVAAHDPRKGGTFGVILLALLLAPAAVARLTGRS